MTEYPMPAAEFNAIYTRVPRLTVEIVVSTHAGIVLSRRAIEPCKGQWHLPGGTVRFGESLHAAVARVARDELAIDVSVGRLLGYIEYPEMLRAGYQGWPVGIAFEATVVQGEPSSGNQSDEVGVFRTVPADTIAEQAAFLRQHLAAQQSVG
jgi:ADP-ribose pyrophosphatase YjhB (NUDIX family)